MWESTAVIFFFKGQALGQRRNKVEQNSERGIKINGVERGLKTCPNRPFSPQTCPPGFHISSCMWTRAEEHLFKAKKERPVPQCHTVLLLSKQGYLHVCSSLSAGRCRGNSPDGDRQLWAVLCCFTLCFPQRSWINITSSPQGITTLVSLLVFIAAAAEVLLCFRALWGWLHTRNFSCALSGNNWITSVSCHEDRSSCDFSGLNTLRKGNTFKCSFCCPARAACSSRKGCESSFCEGWGLVPRTGETTAGQSSAQRQDWAISWGQHFLAVTRRWRVVQWGTTITLGLCKGQTCGEAEVSARMSQ